MTRASLDDVGMAVARAWALRGTCGRRRVGCALFDATGHVLSTGYNGPASGQRHCSAESPCPGFGAPSGQSLHLCEAIHAEANALLRCPDVTRVATCYVTHSPCLDCVKLLLNTGCRRVVYGEPYAHDDAARGRWLAPSADDGSFRRTVELYSPRTWERHGGGLNLASLVAGQAEVRAWAVVDMRSGSPGDRYVESVVMKDNLGVSTRERPPELPGWRVVELTGYYHEDGER